ncbi:hypothetical protein SAY86_018579 [Trapa natans]|uniref:GrpE protein homolog n=1 Tax=Trapa natans TaxID=22666 RepID=A0AAN7LDH6_TRANT|nr:hypothetical protein SAY86_018579 [Trapa natans]
MASVLRTPAIGAPPPPHPRLASFPARASKTSCISFRHISIRHSITASLRLPRFPTGRFTKFVPFSASGDTETTEAEEIQESQLEEPGDGAAVVEDGGAAEISIQEESSDSSISLLLKSYREAIFNNDEPKIAEFKTFLISLEDEKISLENKVAALSAELSVQKDRVLRISADFDNFRKRIDTERLSLVSNARGEVVESLLSVLDNFERAKAQIKVETEGEKKINDSYQSIYKQFMEILTSLGVCPVETVGNPFDPMLHEAIMREDSTEYEEGVIIEEYRKGFKLGERLLRPSMVKVSAGPGPVKEETAEPSKGEMEDSVEAFKETEDSVEASKESSA